ncbi:hypothetical protein IWQ61_004848, partial [Dispira simplex]
NDYDLNGQQCPLLNKRDMSCPLICTTKPEYCPPGLEPDCPQDQSLCGDGTCQKDCSLILNQCNCGAETYPYGAPLYPCKSPGTVDIPSFNPSNKSALVIDACARSLNISPSDYGVWGEDNSQGIWADCPKKGYPRNFTYTEPLWLVIWTVAAAEVFLLITWTMFKRFAERNVDWQISSDRSQMSDEKKAPQVDIQEAVHEEDFQLKGYHDHIYGTLAFYSVIFVSIGWVVLLSVITADYYGKITGIEMGLAKADAGLSGYFFIITWYLAVLWFLVNNVLRARLRNFFRVLCLPHQGNVVQVERRLDAVLMLDDNSALLALVHRWETRLRRLLGWDRMFTTCPVGQTAKGRRYFSYQCTLFVYDTMQGTFSPFDVDLGTSHHTLVNLNGGIITEEAEHRLELLGPNFISVTVPSFPVAMAQEFTGFFYLYQLTILWLYYYFAYYQIGLVDTVVVLISALVKVVIRIKSETRLKCMAEHKDSIQVLRDGKWVKLTTDLLVPGDVFQVTKGIAVPCDAIVLSGNIVADESSLTGEPLPIRKFPIRDDGGYFDHAGSGKINTLFAGTTISQANPLENDNKAKVTALVFRTGTATDKGQLVRNILFPNPITFIFNEQLKVVIVVLLCYGLFLFVMALWMMNEDFVASWFYGMFCISQLISPLLPAALVVGQSMAAGRLRKKHIYCVDLPRIVIAGKVQIFCFDKTGTLTKEGLEFYGAQALESVDAVPAPIRLDQYPIPTSPFGVRRPNYADLSPLMRMGVAAAHTVTEVEDQLIGNPVDIEMFRATQWEICPPESPEYLDTLRPTQEPQDPALHVVKRFEFLHARASMSVAVLDSATGHVHIFVKGSFEKLKDLANPASIPEDYDRVTGQLAQEGCYVLSMAHRDLGVVDLETLRRSSREDLEKDIDFIGLLLFKNTLKPDTTDAITELKQGNTRTVMITGDTALTGVYIAKACGMTPVNDRVLLGDVNKGGELYWIDVDSKEQVILNDTLARQTMSQGVELAVTGKAFRALVENETIRQYLLDIRIFARMTPQDKVDCVQLHMERGITAMCGDGGNDCGALRAAHVGIALSEAEASIVSPFSTNFRSIFSCVELLRQGRAAIATSLADYKYLILYGQIMASLKLMGFYFSTQISQPMWIMVDAFITVGMSVAVTLSGPAERLSASRPTARLLGPQTMASTLGQVFINWMFVIGGYLLLFSQPWFVCNEFDSRLVNLSKWWLLADNYESATLSFIVLFQFVNAAAVFNFGHLFRRSWWRNYPLVLIWAGFITVISYIELADPNRFGCVFRLNCGNPDAFVREGYPRPDFDVEPYNNDLGHNIFPSSFRWTLWGYSIANMVTVALWEYVVVLGPIRNWAKKKHPLPRLRCKQ